MQLASHFTSAIFLNESARVVTGLVAAVYAGELAPYNNKANLLAAVEKKKKLGLMLCMSELVGEYLGGG